MMIAKRTGSALAGVDTGGRRTLASPTDGLQGIDEITLDPLAALATVPPAAQLLLRDYIAGLEAQAGSARALAAAQERAHKAEIDRLVLSAADARSARDAAIASRDAALFGGFLRRWIQRARRVAELAAKVSTSVPPASGGRADRGR